MTYQTLTPAQINYDDSLSSEERSNIERSIATLVKRSAEMTAQRQALTSEQDDVLVAANEPLCRLAQQNPQASQAVDTARAKWQAIKENARWSGAAPTEVRTGDVADWLRFGAVADTIFQPPYHFDWSWLDSDGGHHLSWTAQKSIGAAVIDAAVGYAGDATRLRAHAGVGVSLTTDRDVVVMGRSLRWTHHKYWVGGAIYGGNATSEGGVELTVLEDGNLLTVATDKVWRMRCSNGEVAQWDDEGFAVGAPIEVVWTMRPGRHYTFNVGAWVYVERHDGLFSADSWARGFVSANIGALTLFR
jgi:hypothetical protein